MYITRDHPIHYTHHTMLRRKPPTGQAENVKTNLSNNLFNHLISNVMATLIKVKAGEQQSKIDAVTKETGAKSLAGGLQLSEGNHTLQVADKGAFGILLVDSANGDKWALPIVAGKVGKETFVIDATPGAKTLVIADNFYVGMQAGGKYTITVESRKGRKVVTAVVDATATPNSEEEEE